MLALLAGCGAPNLEPDIPAGVNLAGAWRLNRQASADPNTLITAIVEKEMKHMRGRRDDRDDGFDELDPVGTSGGASGGGGGGRGGNRGGSGSSAEGRQPGGGGFHPRGGMAAYIRIQYTQALDSLLNGEGVVIEQSADRFMIARGDSRRTYTPGGHSVVSVANGVADQTSGWKGREYVIDVRPQVGAHVTERYGLTADGKLIENVSLSAEGGLPKLEFTRVYEKGPLPTRGFPTN
ncbi:MAG: hypothetical protein WDO56_01000 [Gammaproteobacteria bacterium]